jgi:manganese/iron transport system ATP-binding protein
VAGRILAEIRDATVCFNRRRVLDAVTLTVSTGDFWALLGPNGAGKSTFLGLFNGLTSYAAGRVEYRGTVVTPKTASRVRRKIAHVFQSTDVDPKMPMTAFEAVLAGTYGKLGLFRVPGAREKKLAMEALAAVGLSTLAQRPIGHLSGGERQRMALARALAQEPELLLLDEPTASLDWQAQREILNTIETLRRQYDLTVFMVTHDLNAALSLAEKAAMLKQGTLLWSGPAEAAMNPELLSALYDVPVSIAACEKRKVALF